MATRLRGKVRGGVVVLPAGAALADGAEVYVEPVVTTELTPARGHPQAIRAFLGGWVGDAAELDELLAEIQRDRDNDLAPLD